MQANIKILYGLSFLGHMWVWLAIWSLYYLIYTDYAGVGVLEMITFATVTILEIPSGALADLFGRKAILVLSYVFLGVGNILMGLAEGFGFLAFSVFIGAIGFAFVSGAFEAMTYDSLLSLKKEDDYELVYSRQKSIRLFTFGLASLIGSYLYVQFSPAIPFLVTGCIAFCAATLALFLKEPPRERGEAVTFTKVLQQNKEGFSNLFKNTALRPYSILFLLIGLIPLFMYEYAAELTLVEKGATAEQMGLFVTIILFAAALATYVTPYVIRLFGRLYTYIGIGIIYSLLLLAVPQFGLIFIFVFNLFWAASSVMREVIESKVINQHTQSESRATTLSTFSMLRYLPHALTVVGIGYLADIYSISTVVGVFGAVMLALTGTATLYYYIARSKRLSQ